VDRRLSQGQVAEQSLALTQGMRMSLALLQLGPGELAETAVREAARNPFLRIVPPAGTDGRQPIADTLVAEETTVDRLCAQIGLIALAAPEMKLARDLAHCLDERGFFTDPAPEMCRYLATTPALLARVVARLQVAVDPPGVFAWSLTESFRIQLQAKDRCDPIILRLLDRLDLVAQQDVPAICALCAVDAEDAVEMLADIRALRPFPLAPAPVGNATAQDPELIFIPGPDSAIHVELNPAALPQVLVDDGLFDRMRQVELDQGTLSYYRDCHRGAAGFVLAMQKRANTLLRIGQQIAAVQQKYLATGRKLDRTPLTTGSLAKALGLNKSTISRALHDCRIATRHGVVQAADFLVRPINGADQPRTRDQALGRLSVLIRAEDRRHPHSDEALALLMEKANFGISRRTVAKYRSLLGIAGMNERRSRAVHAEPPSG
jgi:RNA polymerase sigma-54 factor